MKRAREEQEEGKQKEKEERKQMRGEDAYGSEHKMMKIQRRETAFRCMNCAKVFTQEREGEKLCVAMDFARFPEHCNKTK